MIDPSFIQGVLASLVAAVIWTSMTTLVSPPVAAFLKYMLHHAIVYLLKSGV
jgi:predicted NAD/FAD-binding protein